MMHRSSLVSGGPIACPPLVLEAAKAPAPAAGVASAARVDALTGLRFLAAAAVYYHHIAAPAGAPQALVTAKRSGYWGVTLFFVLSGFVLALTNFDAMRVPTAKKVWSFAVARVARVYPLYLALLLYWTSQDPAIGTKWTLWLQHAFALQAWSSDMRGAFAFNGPAWSVGVELFLYASFPLLVPLVARIDRSVRSLAIAAAVITGLLSAVAYWFIVTGRAHLPVAHPESAHRWLYRMPALRLGDFALGIVAARLFVRLRGRAGIERLGAGLTLAGFAAFGILTTHPDFVFASFSWDAGYVLPSLAVILGLALAPSTRIARILASRPLKLLGETSYAFYLVHWACLALTGAAWAKVTNASTVAVTLFQLAGVLVLSVGLHVVIEKPARDGLRRWLSWTS